MGTEATVDSGGVRTLQQKMPTTFSEHTVRHRQRKLRLRLSPKVVPRLPRAQIHKQSYYSRARRSQGHLRGKEPQRKEGCPRPPFELLEGSEANRSRSRKAKAPAEATRRTILMALFLPLPKVLGVAHFISGQRSEYSKCEDLGGSWKWPLPQTPLPETLRDPEVSSTAQGGPSGPPRANGSAILYPQCWGQSWLIWGRGRETATKEQPGAAVAVPGVGRASPRRFAK